MKEPRFWTALNVYMALTCLFFWVAVLTGWYARHPTDQHWYNPDAIVHAFLYQGSILFFVEWREYRLHRKQDSVSQGAANGAPPQAKADL